MEEKDVEKWIPRAGSPESPHKAGQFGAGDDGGLADGPAENSHIPLSSHDEMPEGSLKSSPTLQGDTSFSKLDDAVDVGDLSGLDLNLIRTPPKSPALSSTDSMVLTPYSSRDNDEMVIYSDSEVGSQNSLDLRARSSSNSSPAPSLHRGKPRRPSSPRGDSDDSPTPKPRRRLRRKSNKTDSEKSFRSSVRHEHAGSGYTSTPATGKVFRNLLILEESLREQVVQQRALRRKYLTFLSVLCSFIASISHHLYFSNTHGSFRVILQFVLLALIVTLLLYHLSGEYQKTIVLPRKFLSSTNKGIRQLNVRLVKIKVPLTDSIADLIREFSLFIITICLNILHKFDPTAEKNKASKLEVFLVSCQSQCQPKVGLTDVKLVLNARVFNTDVREGWELYRSEFWIHEGVRRRNALMSFATDPEDLKENLLKKDRRVRRERKKSNATHETLSEHNLKQLAESESESVVAA